MFSSPRRGVAHLSDGSRHLWVVLCQRIQRFADRGVRKPETPAHARWLASAMNGVAEQSMQVGRHTVYEQCDRNCSELPWQ